MDKDGSAILYADDVDIARSSGLVYFSDASTLAPDRLWIDGQPDKVCVNHRTPVMTREKMYVYACCVLVTAIKMQGIP